jgi:hypothetical protein
VFEYVEIYASRITISILVHTVLCGCWETVDWKEVWREGERYGMVSWVWGSWW